MGKKSGGTENIMSAIAGSVGAVIGDFVWNSMRLPGYAEPSALKFLSMGDVYQMGATSALTGFGFSKGCSRIAPLAYGAFATQVLTKVIIPAFGLPRYLLFDIDKKGRLVPEKRF
jgi:hypothetical protein